LHETHTDALATTQTLDSAEARITPPFSTKQEDQSIFRDPTMAPPIDFGSEDGFQQAAGKKAKKVAKNAAKWKGDDDEEEGSKKDDGEGSNGGDKGGDTGAGGTGDGDDDKKDDANGDAAGNDDEWDSFMPAKSKKKGKKGAKAEEPAPASAAPVIEKFDAFHEIKLDDTSPMLDLSFETGTTGTKSTSGFGAWGSSWNTGSWDFSATTLDTKKDTTTEIDNNPWSLNRGKPKKKNTGFSFGSVDEEETKLDEVSVQGTLPMQVV
jgi:hypothetical protein